MKIHSPTSSPHFNLVDSDDSDSESDSDEGVRKDDAGILRESRKRQQDIELLPPGLHRESEEEGEEEDTGVGGKLSVLKGKFLSRVKASTNSFLPRPRSHSPQPTNSSSTSELSHALVSASNISIQGNDRERPSDAEGGGDESKAEQGRGAQWVGAMKQRLRVNSPNLFRKMRKVSPSNPSNAPVPSEDEELAKLEEARKKSKTRLIFI